ncbi:MAG: hypothetical protein WDZ35_03475 [Crocinitomicaceae bacterium]
MTQFDLKAKMREAAERIKKEKELEAQRDLEDYQNLLKSGKWKIFIGLMVFCAIMSILVGVDSLAATSKEKVPYEKVEFYSGNMRVNGSYYLPQTGQLGDFQENSFFFKQTLIFKEPKFLCWHREEWQADDNAPKKYVQECTVKRISIFEWFPFLSIGLLVPLFVVLFKRPQPLFKFSRYLCWLIVYPGSLLLFFHLIT